MLNYIVVTAEESNLIKQNIYISAFYNIIKHIVSYLTYSKNVSKGTLTYFHCLSTVNRVNVLVNIKHRIMRSIKSEECIIVHPIVQHYFTLNHYFN